MNKAGYIILAPGPLHLFWTTGVYYLWELSKEYKVILIVDETYLNDKEFQKIKAYNVAETLYLPVFRYNYLGHKTYYKKCKQIVEAYRPLFVFQHNPSYIDNIYLFYASKTIKHDCHRISFQSGKEALNLVEDYNVRHSSSIRKHRLSSLMPEWLNRINNKYRILRNTIITYYVLPFFVSGRVFVPYFNVYNGKYKYPGEKLKRKIKSRYDWYLAYYKCEIDAVSSWQGYNDDMVHIKHPVETVGKDVHEALYQFNGEEQIIAIFPTYGFTDYLNIQRGMSLGEIIEQVSNSWIAAIEVLKSKFPGYRVVWKLHPASVDDKVMQAITDRIKTRFNSKVAVVSPTENAQKWIVNSKFVVTDVSTIFWWANLLQNKLVLSLDIFGFPGGDDAKSYDGVYYFNSLKSLEMFDFGKINDLQDRRQCLPSLSVFTRDLLNCSE